MSEPPALSPWHPPDAEAALIGIMLADIQAITYLAGRLQPERFRDPLFQSAYRAMRDLHARAQPTDLATVAAELRRRNELRPGDLGQLAACLGSALSAVVAPDLVHQFTSDATPASAAS